ncbi:3-dehydrosphinganine reductase-like [Brevipalpus obovatus]|uniref:3-dehydrosphinganine reductase-like n=1 Tax=Brevipalpus obovatus TaxID=246614 RepID=UPI003D9F303C
MLAAIFIASLATLPVLLLVLIRHNRKGLKKLQGRHVVVSGGSKGIGREVALKCFKAGAKVTILARDEHALEQAKEYMIEQSKLTDRSDDIECFSVDVSGSYEALVDIFDQAEKNLGPIDGLFNIVGRAICSRFEESEVDDFNSMMSVNFFSAVNCSRAAVDKMINRKQGFIQLTSSMAGLMGIYGFTAYSSSKFALIGLAESLAMELKPHNISLTVAFPPDTDTPGYEIENLNKPIETKMICESAGLWSASKVADAIVEDTLAGKFSSTVGAEGFMLRILSSGAMRSNGIISTLTEVFLMGPLRLISMVIIYHFDKIVNNCTNRRLTEKN